MDKIGAASCFPAMSQPVEKFTSPVSLVVDAILVILFFGLMYRLISPHVPSQDGVMVLFWGGAAASCLTAVFWLAIQMFRVVLKAQRRR